MSRWAVFTFFGVLAFTLIIGAQDRTITGESIKSIKQFGGLNTAGGDFSIQPNEFRQLINIDLNRNLGSLTKRYGYDTVGIVSEGDSILSIYGASFSDGRQFLVIVADSISGGAADTSGLTGYGNVYITPFGSDNVTDSLTRVATYWGIQNRTDFTMHRDNIFMVNGQQKGLIITEEGVSRTFPIRAGGEPLIVPLKRAGGELHGQYVYRVSSNGGGFTKSAGQEGGGQHANGVLSSPIWVDSGRALLTNFQLPQPDSTDWVKRKQTFVRVDNVNDVTLYWIQINGADSAKYTSDGSATLAEIRDSLVDSVNNAVAAIFDTVSAKAMGDSIIMVYVDSAYGDFSTAVQSDLFKTEDEGVQFFIHRTRGNSGVIDESDSAILIRTFTLSKTDTIRLDTMVIIDSIGDTAAYNNVLFDVIRYGRDSVGVLTFRLGSLRYSSGDTVAGASDSNGLFRGWPFEQPDTLGVYYTYAWIDTLLGIEGDTARSLFVYCNQGQNWDEITLRLPILPTRDSGLVLNLYRGAILQMTHDSGFWKQDTTVIYVGTNSPLTESENWSQLNPDIPAEEPQAFFRTRRSWLDVLVPDSTIRGTPYLVKQLPSTDTSYTDTLSHQNLTTHRPYRRATPPSRLKNLVTFQDRVYGTVGSRLYFSKLDTGFAWGAFDFITLDESDGDEITGIYAARDAIRVFKNKKTYNVFQDALLRWTRSEVSGYIGNAARYSIQSGVGGTYYFSDEGVLRESEGLYRDRQFDVKLISEKIILLDTLSITEKAAAIGFYNDRAFMLSLPTVGSTLVYFDKVNAWGSYDFVFGGATHYAKEPASNYGQFQFIPLDTMYFFKPGDSVIFKYASSEQDGGNVIPIRAVSAPLFTEDMNLYKRINRVGIITDASVQDTLVVQLIDEEGNTVGSDINYLDLRTKYQVGATSDGAIGRYLQYRLTNQTGDWSATTRIEGIELFYQIEGQNDDN